MEEVLYDIPLEEKKRDPPPEVDPGYPAKIGRSIAIILYHAVLPDAAWTLISSLPSPKVGYFYEGPVHSASMTKNSAAYKVVALVTGRAKRILYALKDHDPITRLPWDKDAFISVKHCETFKRDEGDIDVVQSHLREGNFFLQGIQTTAFNPELNTFTYYFTTAENPRYAPPPTGDVVVVDTLMLGVFVRQLDKGMCEITMVVCVKNPGGRFLLLPQMLLRGYAEMMLKRVELLERVAGKEWDVWYGKERDPKKKRW